MNALLFLSLVSVFVLRQVIGFKVCGDDVTNKAETNEAINEIVDRLMAMRKTDWTWNIATTAMVIQLVAPQKFYGREKTIDAIREKVKLEVNNMSLLNLALHTKSVKGLCQNPRNFSGYDLVKMVEDKLKSQFGYKRIAPTDGLRTYAIGLSALCISNYPVQRYLMNKVLVNQNKDGSFGTRSKIVTTASLLPPMHCLSRETNTKFRVERVTNAIKKMRAYLKSNIHTDGKNHTYIGSPSTSTFALLGMQSTQESGESPDSWKCREVMRSLGLKPGPNESEYMLVTRLLRISGRSYREFRNSDWTCPMPDPMPVGYQPMCDPSKPETCKIQEGTKQKEE